MVKLNNWKAQQHLFQCENVGPKARTAGSGLIHHRNVRTGQCNPSIRTLAREARRGHDYILDGIDELVINKWASVKTGTQRISSQYFIFFDDVENAEQHWSEDKAAEAAERIEKRKKYGGKKFPERHQGDRDEKSSPQPTEEDREMPQPVKIDPALVDLVTEIKERGLTRSSDLKEDLITAANVILKQGRKTLWVAQRFNEAKIPRLRGGEKPWQDADVRQMLNPPTRKPKAAKPPPEKAPASVKQKCDGCDVYNKDTNECCHFHHPRENPTFCPRGKWEEGESS